MIRKKIIVVETLSDLPTSQQLSALLRQHLALILKLNFLQKRGTNNSCSNNSCHPALPRDVAISVLQHIFSHPFQLHRHSNDVGFFWDVKPKSISASSPAASQSAESLPRSHKMDQFEFHTDCCYESDPPRFVGMFCLRGDKFGGGLSSILSVDDVLSHLSPDDIEVLSETDFPIKVPLEFYKGGKSVLHEPLLLHDEEKRGKEKSVNKFILRYRSDIVDKSALTSAQLRALENLENQIGKRELRDEFLLDDSSLLLVDNGKLLHARSKVLDADRHLLRARFNVVGK